MFTDLNEFHYHLCQLKNRMWRRSPTRGQSGWLRLQLVARIAKDFDLETIENDRFKGLEKRHDFFMKWKHHDTSHFGIPIVLSPAIQGNEELAKYAETHHDAHAATEAVAVLARFWLILVDISCSPFIPFEVANGCWMQQMLGICWDKPVKKLHRNQSFSPGGQVSKIRLEEVRLAGTLSLQVRDAGPKCSNCPRERDHQKFQTFTCPNCFTDVLIREH